MKGPASSQGGGAEGLRSDLDPLDIAQSDGGTLDTESLGQPCIARDQSSQEKNTGGLIT